MSPAQHNRLTVLVKRFLELTWILFLGIAIVWPIVIMVVGLNIPSEPAERHTDLSAFLNFRVFAEQPVDVTSELDRGDLILSGQGELLLNNTHGRLGWYLSGAMSQIMLLAFLYGLLILRRLFASLVDGNTFTAENSKSIKKIGYLVTAWHIIMPLLQYLGGHLVLEDIAFNQANILLYPGFEFDIGGVFTGLAIIVLSGVLREAASIHQDQQLTI